MGKRGDPSVVSMERAWDPASPDPMERSEHALPDADVLFPELPPEVLELAETNLFVKAETDRNKKKRLRATSLLVLRQQGRGHREIASLLHMTPQAVRQALYRARAAGRLNDLTNVLRTETAALAVDSANFHLRKKDKEMTIETLKGLGHFRSYTDNKNSGMPAGAAGFPPLTVNIINAPNQGQTVMVEPLGVPREDAIE